MVRVSSNEARDFVKQGGGAASLSSATKPSSTTLTQQAVQKWTVSSSSSSPSSSSTSLTGSQLDGSPAERALVIVADACSFDTLCQLLRVSRRVSRAVDLRAHNAETNTVVERLCTAYERSMLTLRKFELEFRTVTRARLWPYYGVEMERDENGGTAWTIVAPAVRVCLAGVDDDTIPETEASRDAFVPWAQACDEQFDFVRVKTRSWDIKSLLMRMAAMHAHRHRQCVHAATFNEFVAQTLRSSPLSKPPHRPRKPRKKKPPAKKASKRKTSTTSAQPTRASTVLSPPAPKRPHLSNFNPDTDAARLVHLQRDNVGTSSVPLLVPPAPFISPSANNDDNARPNIGPEIPLVVPEPVQE